MERDFGEILEKGGSGGNLMADRIGEAREVEPATFRYSDAGLGGEVRTRTVSEGGIYSRAEAEVVNRSGEHKTVGTALYKVDGTDAYLAPDRVYASNYGVESALLSEVGQTARAQGADRLNVWVPDGDTSAEDRWRIQGFQPGARNPGAAGVHWQRPL
jgi:hypothetical protein